MRVEYDDEEITRFTYRIEKRAKNVVDNMDLLRRAVVKEMLTEVVYSTPADTGAARSNWKVGNGRVPTGVRRPYAPGRKLGLSETANAAAAVSQGESVLSRSKGEQNIYIANSVPYINLLDEGWSSQAPANFIQKAIDRGAARARAAQRLLEPSSGLGE